MRMFVLATLGLALLSAPDARGVQLAADASVDQVLDALDASGDNLRDFSADVEMSDIDNQTGDEKKRMGSVVYERRGEADVRMKVDFSRKVEDGRIIAERIVYHLQDGWLTDRDYRSKLEVRRQVLKPGEKVDLLKLGEGPFPLPIGQDKTEVHKQMDVRKLDPAEGIEPEEAKKLIDSLRLQLVPRESSNLRDRFKQIDVWVDPKTNMPIRIETVSPNDTSIQVTELSKLKMNQGLTDQPFKLEPVEGWSRRDEKLEP